MKEPTAHSDLAPGAACAAKEPASPAPTRAGVREEKEGSERRSALTRATAAAPAEQQRESAPRQTRATRADEAARSMGIGTAGAGAEARSAQGAATGSGTTGGPALARLPRFHPAEFISPIRVMRAIKHPLAADLSLGEPLECWPEGAARELGAHLGQCISASGMPYLPADGMPALRRHLGGRYGTEHVTITSGAQAALAAAIQASVMPGDRVAIQDPGFIAYPLLVRWAGGEPVPIDARRAADGLDLETLQGAFRSGVKGLILGQPSNPTGLALTREALARTLALAAEHGVWVIVDTVYALLPMAWPSVPTPHLAVAAPPASRGAPGQEASAGRPCDGLWGDVPAPPELRLAIVSSVSKNWCAPGLRVGWMASRDRTWVERTTKVHALMNTHVSSLSQAAALWLIEHLPTDAIAATLRERGRTALATLAPAIGTLSLPPGAFYLFLSLPGLPDDMELARRAAASPEGVAVVAGSVFGVRGKGHLRLSYGVPPQRLVPALERLIPFLPREP